MNQTWEAHVAILLLKTMTPEYLLVSILDHFGECPKTHEIDDGSTLLPIFSYQKLFIFW